MKGRQPFRAAVLSIGSELTSGRTQDSNAAFLASEVRRLGGRVDEIRSLPDDLPAMARALRELARGRSLLLVTGGLGPTEDDRTRQALARASGRPLRLHRPSLEAIQARFRRAGRAMTANNRLQALFPAGALPLPNAQGTAPGIRMRLASCRVLAFPGVPSEMRAMWEPCRGGVARELGRPPLLLRRLHVFGLAESEVDRRMRRLMAPGRDPEAGLTVSDAVITVSLTSSSPARIAGDEKALRRLLGRAVFGVDGEGLAAAVVARLRRRRRTLALAESATGGLISHLVTEVPGASKVLWEGRAVYTVAAKRRLGVPAPLLKRHGPVSEAVTRELASRIRRVSGATYGLAVTGLAGPSGGTRKTPVGTCFLALAGPRGLQAARRIFLLGERALVKRRAALAALDFLRLSVGG